jgi:MFS family permease
LKSLYLLVLISAASHLAHDATRLAVSLYAIHLRASPAVIGMLGALFALLPAVSSIPIGRWIDRHGARGAMLACSLMVVIGCVLPWIWGAVPALIATSVIVGTFYNAFFIASSRLLAQFGRPGEHVRNISLSSTGYSIAIFLAPLAAGFSIDAVSFQATFLLLALLPLPSLAVIGLRRITFPPRQRRPAAGTPPRTGLLQLAFTGRLRDILGATVMSQVCWSLYLFLMPLYGSALGMSASRIGVVMAAVALATVLVRAVLPVFVRTLTTWQVMLLALGGAAFCMAALPFLSGFGALLALCLVLGVCLGLSGPMALTLLYEASPPDRLGEMLGMRVTLMNASFTVVPLLSGSIMAAAGLAPVFWLVGALLGAGSVSLASHWHDPRVPHRQHGSPEKD